jgi:hypothetical protein
MMRTQRVARCGIWVVAAFWAFFVIASHFAEPMALLAGSAIFVPLILLGWAVPRCPRVVGVVLVVLAGVAYRFFGVHRMLSDRPGQWGVFLLLVLPLLLAGTTLLVSRRR